MEIGQKYRMKIMLQHEFGMIFAERFKNLPLRVVEANPSIVKAELSEQNSALIISAQNKGETNVILYCPRSKKIYDIIKVSVFTSFVFPEKINLNIGASIDFLSKNPNKKSYLMYDAEWKVEDPSILKLDASTNTFKAVSEGKTRVHLLSKDKTKAKLSTWVNVGRIKKITVINSPNLITPIKTHASYLPEYRFGFRTFLDQDEELTVSDDINEIDQRLNVKCVSNNPNVFTSGIELKKGKGNQVISDERECVIKLREVKYETKIPKNIEVELVTESQGERPQDRFSFRTKVEIPYVEPFRLQNDIKEVEFNKNNRTAILEFSNLNDVEITTDEPKFVKIVKESDNKVKISVPHEVADSFKDIRVTFYNKLSSQTEDVNVSFNAAEEEAPRKNTVLGLNRSTLVDLLSMLVLLAVIVLLFKAFLEKRPSDYNFNQHPGIPMDFQSANKAPRGSSLKSLNMTNQ